MPGGLAGSRPTGRRLIPGVPEPGRDMEIGGIPVDRAQGSRLDEPARLENADPVSHGHRLDLVMGDIEHGGAKLALDPLELQAQIGARSLASSEESGSSIQVDIGSAHQRGRWQRAASRPLPDSRVARVVELVLDADEARDLFDARGDRGFGEAGDRAPMSGKARLSRTLRCG